jgi:hypothetical protein
LPSSTTNNLLANISFAPTWDILVILGAVIGVFIYGMTMGKNKLFALLLSTYFSFVIVAFAPWKNIGAMFGYAASFPSPAGEVFIFLALIVAFCFLLPSSTLGSTLRLGKVSKGVWYQILIFSILEVGLLASVVLSLLPVNTYSDLNPLVKQFFIDPLLQFFWILVPLLAMVLLRKGRAEA